MITGMSTHICVCMCICVCVCACVHEHALHACLCVRVCMEGGLSTATGVELGTAYSIREKKSW